MTRDEAIRLNLEIFLNEGPRMNRRYVVFVVAKDSRQERALVGGLGPCGVGEMWVIANEEVKSYPGWEEAPVQEYDGRVLDACANAIREFEAMLEWRHRQDEAAG